MRFIDEYRSGKMNNTDFKIEWDSFIYDRSVIEEHIVECLASSDISLDQCKLIEKDGLFLTSVSDNWNHNRKVVVSATDHKKQNSYGPKNEQVVIGKFSCDIREKHIPATIPYKEFSESMKDILLMKMI